MGCAGSVRGRGGLSHRAGGVTGVAIEDVGYGGVCKLQPRTDGDPASRDIAAQCPAGQWMTETNMPLIELLQKHDEGDFLRAVTEAVLQTLMEHDVEGVIGAGHYGCCPVATALGVRARWSFAGSGMRSSILPPPGAHGRCCRCTGVWL